ncbi:MAG: crossover junction endodeoxyribonuclease RuvC [Bacteroidales bacterium]
METHLNFDRIILGIDPGTNNMGIGIIGINNKKVEVLAMDILDLTRLTDHHLKLKKIFETVLRNIDHFHPDELAIESQFFGKNVQSMLKLGRAQGVAIAAALHRDIPVFEYSPRKIKQSVTGKGSASKEQVACMLQGILQLSTLPELLDITDALAVAYCHYNQKGLPGGSASSSYTGWKAFIANNPGRIVK